MSDSRVHEFDGIYLGGSMIPVIINTNSLIFHLRQIFIFFSFNFIYIIVKFFLYILLINIYIKILYNK